MLKSNLYKNIGQDIFITHRDLQACFVSLEVNDISSALGCAKNIFAPIINVSRLYLLAGDNPDHLPDYMDHCPLLGMYAHLGNTDMVSLLLEYNADSNQTNDKGVTPLILASEAGHIDIVQLLIQHGASINSMDSEGKCAMVAAAQAGHLHILEYLLAQTDVLIQRSPLSQPRTLDLGENHISVLPDTSLYGLRLSGSSISELSRSMFDMTSSDGLPSAQNDSKLQWFIPKNLL